jgi:hypothetical protein
VQFRGLPSAPTGIATSWRRRPITAALPTHLVLAFFFERHLIRAGIAGEGTNIDIPQL